MDKIYHRFKLIDWEKIVPKDRVNYNYSNKKILLEKLAEKGYDIFEGNSAYNSIPTNIIVGGPVKENIKSSFFEITMKLGLRYHSEEFYIKINNI